MESKIIDQLYLLDCIEGVAIFNREGQILENQLAFDDQSVSVIGNSLCQLKEQLAAATRECRGFYMKIGRVAFLAVSWGESLVVLQLSEFDALDRIFNAIRSILGPPRPAVIDSSPQEVIHAEIESEKIPIDAPPADTINVANFCESITKILTRVAPVNLVNKIISDALAKSNVDGDLMTFKCASEIGDIAIAAVPNPARRKMVEKEVQILLENIEH